METGPKQLDLRRSPRPHHEVSAIRERLLAFSALGSTSASQVEEQPLLQPKHFHYLVIPFGLLQTLGPGHFHAGAPDHQARVASQTYQSLLVAHLGHQSTPARILQLSIPPLPHQPLRLPPLHF